MSSVWRLVGLSAVLGIAVVASHAALGNGNFATNVLAFAFAMTTGAACLVYAKNMRPWP